MSKRSKKQILTQDEITQPFIGEWADRFPVILSVKQLAELLGMSPNTIYEWISKGRFERTFRKRGKHIRFWRNKALDIYFNGPDWS